MPWDSDGVDDGPSTSATTMPSMPLVLRAVRRGAVRVRGRVLPHDSEMTVHRHQLVLLASRLNWKKLD